MSAETATSVAAEVIAAITAGDAEGLRGILERDPAAAGARADGGDSPLLLALYHGRRDLAELLRAHGRRPDAFEAAALGDVEALRAVLDAEPGSVTGYSSDGWTALHLAGFMGHVDTVRLLLERGADSNALSVNAMRNTPLHAGLAGPLPHEGARLLVEAGADVNARQHGGYVPLHSAANREEVRTLELLLDRGAEVDAAAEDGRRAIDFARERGNAAAVERLLARGAAP
jgi:uncharacterized protein